MTQSMIVKDLMSAFLMGGFIIAGVKFLAMEVNPSVAAVFGAIPIGMISSNFITDDKVERYVQSYLGVVFMLLIAAITYYVLLKKYEVNRYIAFGISLALWAILSFGRLHIVGQL